MKIYARSNFVLEESLTYLNGHSLGPLPRAARAAVTRTVTHEWGQELIRAWNTCGWMDQPGRLGDKIAPLIGALPGTVMVGDTLTLKLMQALQAALALSRRGKRVLSDRGNFPSDLYAASALVQEVVLVEPEAVLSRLDRDIDVLMITQVDYRSARRHDMARLTAAAHDLGIVCVWDLAHSAGTLAVELDRCGAEFAVGCSYKYLNGGPGAPAFIYARPDLIDQVSPTLRGWMGHAKPFDFAPDYRPGQGRERWRIGTPPVLQMAALEGALELWQGLDMTVVEQAGSDLGQRLVEEMAVHCPQLICQSPRDSAQRGGHVAFSHPHAYALMQVLIAQGIIGDFRAPDLIRFGISPLYNSPEDITHLVAALGQALDSDSYLHPELQKRQQVT